jgi:phosphatidylglycerophosphate synthase
LLERQVKQLRALGFAAPLLLVPHGQPVPELPADCGGLALERVPETRTALEALVAAVGVLAEDFLFLASDHLVDRRVLLALAAHPGPRLARAADDEPPGIGRIGVDDLRRHGVELSAHAAQLSLAAVDAYDPELRGSVPPYLRAVRSAADRRAAGEILLDHVQKRTLDIPGQYFDTPFENFLVRRLAPTSVTPNQVTLLTLIIAAGVGLLFWWGWLRSAVLLALLVGVLDGVDGKLARLKLATSRIGELEHVGDFFYENLWYVALGLQLRTSTGSAGFAAAGLCLVALDLADNLLYGAVRARTGALLDELRPFDRRFRRIAGRRNVYVWILVPGVLTGHVATAFAAVVAWAAVTVGVHAVRAAGVLRGRRPPCAQGSEIESAAGALVSEK